MHLYHGARLTLGTSAESLPEFAILSISRQDVFCRHSRGCEQHGHGLECGLQLPPAAPVGSSCAPEIAPLAQSPPTYTHDTLGVTR